MANRVPTCPVHGTRMICPHCIAAMGGNSTARKHPEKLSEWGKLGGRPRKKKD
jgi:hypothetical protein